MRVSKSKRSRTIWFDDAKGLVLHGGNKNRRLRDFGFPLHESELGSISATDLQHALSDSADDDAVVVVTNTDIVWIHEDVIPASGIDFGLHDGKLVMLIDVGMEYTDDDAKLAELTSRLISPILARHGGQLVSVEHDGYYIGESPWPTLVTIRPVTRGRSLEQLYRLGVAVAAVIDAASGGELTRKPTLDLLRAGKSTALIGQPEGQWLDVKEQLYDVGQLKGKISLAQAAARFANSEGGLVVFGMDTRKVGSGEVIAKVRPVPTDAKTVRRYRQALEQHLYPLPVGLEVEIVPASDIQHGGRLVVVHVPPQPEEVKPFLVHGAVVDGKTEGAFISIVRRHGEDTIPITAHAVHAAMSMNRVLDRLRDTTDPTEPRTSQP